MVTFLFSVHSIAEAKQYAGVEPGRWIFHPGYLTWRAVPGAAPPLCGRLNSFCGCMSVCLSVCVCVIR